jgi:peroxiredoxin
MRRKSGGGIGIAGITILLLIFALNWDHQAGKQAPDFTLDQAYGGRVDLAAYRGRPVLIVFWTTSCSICRHELPLLDRLRTDFRATGVEILAINIRDLDGAREFMSVRHLGLTNLVDADGQTARNYKVSGVPKLVLIGADGKIRRSAAGWQDEETLRSWLREAAT